MTLSGKSDNPIAERQVLESTANVLRKMLPGWEEGTGVVTSPAESLIQAADDTASQSLRHRTRPLYEMVGHECGTGEGTKVTV